MAENLIVNLPFLSPRSILRSGFTSGSLRFPYIRRSTANPRSIFQIFHLRKTIYYILLLLSSATQVTEKQTRLTRCYMSRLVGLIFKLLFWHQRGSIGGLVEPEFDFCRDRFRLIPHLFPLFNICKWLLNKCFTVRVNAIWNSLHAAGYVGDVTLKRCRPTAQVSVILN